MNQLVPDSDAEQYIRTVLSLYQKLPETPSLPSSRDRFHAHLLLQRKLSLTLIETAFLLGSLRRLLRPSNASHLSPIHSLAYFEPVIEELLQSPVPDSYIEYLRHKMQPFADKKINRSQTFPGGRSKNITS